MPRGLMSCVRAALCCLAVVSAWTGTKATAGDFAMRRVGPPEPGARRLITVQIEEAQEPVERDATGDALGQIDEAIAGLERLGPVVPETAKIGGPGEWLWDFLPKRHGPGRLSEAADLLASEADDPRMEGARARIRHIGRKYGAEISRATERTDVSPALVLAVIMVESAGRSEAVSHAGAGGLMQLMPATAKRFGVRERFDPGQNIRGGVAYLDWLLGKFEGDAILALAGYNAGENAVIRHGGVPPYAETRNYIPKVVSAWRLSSELCRSPQVTAGDACDWNDLALNAY